jgi:hypothetical protein
VAINALVHEMFPPVAAVLPADTQARGAAPHVGLTRTPPAPVQQITLIQARQYGRTVYRPRPVT